MKDHYDNQHGVIEAIESLLRDDMPNANAQQVGKLLAASISQLVPRDQRALCAMLVKKKTCSVDIMRQLLAAKVDGIEHLVANAPWVSHEHALEVIRIAGASSASRALARRADLDVVAKRALRELNDPAIDRALELRQVGPTGAPVVEHREPAIDLGTPRRIFSLADFQDYLNHASEEHPSLMATAISDNYDIAFGLALNILSGDDLKLLAALMRAIGMHKDMAEQLLARLRWRSYPDRAQKTEFVAAFESMSVNAAFNTLDDAGRSAA
ncbi:MAG: hypothetical protein AAFY99_11225 [Pseudomonadota bacterium]